MTSQEKKLLEQMSKALEEAQSLIRELLHDQYPPTQQRSLPAFDARGVLLSLKGIERLVAERQLTAMKQQDLGAVFVESGGPSSDKKKPKAWLIEQILWRIFDFEHGHEAIRSKGAGEI